MATDPIDDARSLLRDARRVVVLTGAGISTASGIPDFRGPNGVWTKDPRAEMLSTFDVWRRDPEVRRAAWRSRAERSVFDVEPTNAHRALVDLETRGVLDLLITQNIDGLHQRAGSDPSLVVEIHGSALDALCLKCGKRSAIDETLQRVRAGDDDPTCLEVIDGATCSGMMKSATISFGQSLIAEDLARAERSARSCDLLLAVGSTLAVYPVAALVPMAHAHGARVVIVNQGETNMDEIANVIVPGDINTSLPAIVKD